MSASLGKFLVVLIGNQGKVYIHRNLPSECLVKTVVFRGRGKIFISSYHMGNTHEMVIYYVCKIISRISVRFHKNHIIQLCIIHLDVSVKLIMEYGFTLIRIVLTNDKGFTLCQIFLYFLFG